MPVSERRLCRVLGQHRSTQRKAPRGADDEAALTEDIIALARQYGRYGYRRVTALLRDAPPRNRSYSRLDTSFCTCHTMIGESSFIDSVIWHFQRILRVSG